MQERIRINYGVGMTPPRQSPLRARAVGAHDDSQPQRDQFRHWQRVPPTTPLRDLQTTSLLVIARDSRSGRLLRCSPALEAGSAQLVHADVRRPNAIRMLEMDDDSPIGEQARALLAEADHVVAIPHITWKHFDGGMRWRTPATVLVALVTALAVVLLAPPWGVATALPVAAATGLLTWLVLRRRVPTTIAPFDGQQHGAIDVLAHARHSTQHAPGSDFPPPRD